MGPDPKSPGSGSFPADFRAALVAGWILLATAGLLYAHFKQLPAWVAIPVLGAFLLEYLFYLLPAFPDLRRRLAAAPFPALVVLSFVLPYFICYGPMGHLSFANLVKLVAVGLAVGLWYVVLPASFFTDFAFLVLLAAVLLSRLFDSIYPAVYPGLPIAILGRISFFLAAILVLLIQRRVGDAGYGFIPNLREWRIGALHYLAFLPAAACVAFPLKAVHLVTPAPLWKTIGIFLGFLWVVALFEEFLFRGVLLGWIEERGGRRTAALLITSMLFGFVHLWFRGFPNWRGALLAAMLGWFCGHARIQAGSIRAGVVTHALVVATWRGFFA